MLSARNESPISQVKPEKRWNTEATIIKNKKKIDVS